MMTVKSYDEADTYIWQVQVCCSYHYTYFNQSLVTKQDKKALTIS